MIEKVVCGVLSANCYLMSDDTATVIIDPGKLVPRIKEFVLENKGKSFYIILTHCHFDHALAVSKIKEMCNAKVVAASYEQEGLLDTAINLGGHFGNGMAPIVADVLLNDNDIFKAGGMSFEILHTPGHTEGGISILYDDILFTGDVLFKGSVGRTDFPGGDLTKLKNSLRRICCLDSSVKIYPGHGEVSTIAAELNTNPFLDFINNNETL